MGRTIREIGTIEAKEGFQVSGKIRHKSPSTQAIISNFSKMEKMYGKENLQLLEFFILEL